MATLDTVNYSTSFTGLGLQMAISTGISAACLLGFVVARRTKAYGYLYAARSRYPSGLLSNENSQLLSLWALAKKVYAATEDEVLEQIGLDAAMFLRFSRMCIQIALFLCFTTVIILVPIHASFTPENSISGVTSQLDTYSIANVPQDSKILWFHAAFTWIVAIVTMLLLYHNYLWYADKFHESFARQVENDEIQTRSIMIRGLPVDMQSEEALRACFHALNLGEVESVVLSRSYTKLERRLAKREYYLALLERSHMKLAHNYHAFHSERWLKVPRAVFEVKRLARTILNHVLQFLTLQNVAQRRLSRHPTMGPPSRKSTMNMRQRIFRSTVECEDSSDSDTDLLNDQDGDADSTCAPTSDTAQDRFSGLPSEEANYATLNSQLNFTARNQSLVDFPACTPSGNSRSDSKPPLNVTNWKSIMNPKNRDTLHEFQPMHLTPRGRLVYSVDMSVQKLAFHDARIRQDRAVSEIEEKFNPLSAAFMTFKSPSAAVLCAQAHIMPHGCKVRLAPEPRDMIWSNFALSTSIERNAARLGINIAIGILIFIWVVPVSLVVTMLSIDKVVRVLRFLEPLTKTSEVFKSLLSGFLPSLTASVFTFVFPYLLAALLRAQGYYAKSSMNRALARWYFAFLLFDILLAFTVGQSLVTTLIDLFLPVNPFKKDPAQETSADSNGAKNLASIIAQAIPRGANFYLNYIVFQTCLHACELLQINGNLLIAFYSTSRFAASTPRQLFRARQPSDFVYFYYQCGLALVLIIMLVYSVIHPLIAVVALLYFTVGWFVYKHQLLMSYVKSYEDNGRVWHDIVWWIWFGLILLEITMIGYLAINKIWVGASLIFILICGTIWFKHYCKKSIRVQCRYIPLNTLVMVLQKRSRNKSQAPQHAEGYELANLDRGTNLTQTADPTNNPLGTPAESTVDLALSPNQENSFLNSHQAGGQRHFSLDDLYSNPALAQELANPNPQTYFPPCVWSPLPTSMWLPSKPLHMDRYNLGKCEHISQFCPSLEMYLNRNNNLTFPNVSPEPVPTSPERDGYTSKDRVPDTTYHTPEQQMESESPIEPPMQISAALARANTRLRYPSPRPNPNHQREPSSPSTLRLAQRPRALTFANPIDSASSSTRLIIADQMREPNLGSQPET